MRTQGIHVQSLSSASRWALVFFLGTSVDPPSPAAERKGGMWKRCEAYSAFCEGGDSTETACDTQFHRGCVLKGLVSPESHLGRGLAPENWC